MIIYDLSCDNQHRFEGWFRSPDDFEWQIERHLVNCPQCDSATVRRIPSAVAAAQTYDALRLISLAIFQANSTEGPQIQAALEDMRHNTTSTVVTRYAKPFSKTDHEAISANMIVMGEIRKGQVVYAYKEDANNSVTMRTKASGK